MTHSVILLGATGTIGRATYAALIAKGHRVVAPVRAACDLPKSVVTPFTQDALAALMVATDCDAVISCLASRTGTPGDAKAIDHDLNSMALAAAQTAGVASFVLLSAICVQKPKLAFQHAKLAFEAELRAAPITWSIVRPTAYFKSLSGQVDRLRAGKPFLLFGNGALTACKPISDADLADFLVRCISTPAMQNQTLPIGGPGPAITPRQQGEMLFAALGLTPRFTQVPVAMMTAIIGVLSLFGLVSKRARDKAELARIGRYYATESMLVWDTSTQRYDPDTTPEYGTQTLTAHYALLAASQASDDRGAHAVF